ncbi:MAG: protoporphyrinogen oxidase, partial [Gammaproteobacteria bacterium]
MKKIAIVGAGISGLATAFEIRKRLQNAGLDHELYIFEACGKVGGKIGATVRDGFLCEAGPDGFLDSKPSTLQLCQELGISDQLLSSNEIAKRRFIYSGQRLHEIPTTPFRFLSSSLLTIRGRLRVIGELWASRGKEGEDHSIADFGIRHLGAEAYAKLLDPMIGGVFAGDATKLSLASCFPRMAELERDYGSLIKAMIKLAVKRRKVPDKDGGGPAGPGGTLTSFRDGLSVLPNAIANLFPERITCNAKLREIHALPRGYSLSFEGTHHIECDCVIVATQAADAVRPMRYLDASIADILEQFEYAPVTVVGLGFDRSTIKNPLDGFGFLVPTAEDREILGNLWTSSIFPYRAPEGHVLLRTIIGGVRTPELAFLSDEETIALVRKELAEILGITAEPKFVQLSRWEKAICQY